MRILYDSKNQIHKTPFGCLKQDEACIISIHVPSSCKTIRSFLCFEREDGFYTKFEMKKASSENSYDIFSTEFSLSECGLYFYYFKIETENSSFKLMKFNENDTNIEDGEKWQLTCYDKDFKTPDAFKGRVMYQIFPDRFYKEEICDLSEKLSPFWVHENEDEIPAFLPDENGKILNNDFYGGNLKGIEKKLEYLKELNVGIIYLNPIFKAYSNHRYDTCDYKKIDPMLGCEDDFVSLCKKAHELDIKIILDGVFSHTGCDSIYFDKYNHFENGAFNNPHSPYKSWYNFKNYPHEYESWWGIDTLPCVNELDENYIKYILTDDDSVIRHWLRLGADGFRLDVADELPDEFIKILHNTVKEENPEALVLGEVWEDASNKIAYSVRRKYFVNSELDSVMNYPFRTAIINLLKGSITTEQFENSVMTICENYPKEITDCLMNSLSTHDTPRILTNLTNADMGMSREHQAKHKFTAEEIKKASQLSKTAVFLQFFLPGTACIYYGDEIGMQGFGDPFNRAFFNWNDISNETSDFYRAITLLKNKLNPLKEGDIRFVSSKDGVLVMERSFEEKSVTAVVNLSDESLKITSKRYHITHNCTCLNDSVYVQKNGFALYE